MATLGPLRTHSPNQVCPPRRPEAPASCPRSGPGLALPDKQQRGFRLTLGGWWRGPRPRIGGRGGPSRTGSWPHVLLEEGPQHADHLSALSEVPGGRRAPLELGGHTAVLQEHAALRANRPGGLRRQTCRGQHTRQRWAPTLPTAGRILASPGDGLDGGPASEAPGSPSGTTAYSLELAAKTTPLPRCGSSGYGLGPRISHQPPG